MTATPPVSVRADPSPEYWGAMAAERFAGIKPEHLRHRAELGLPTDRPVVMTGHQAGFWHAGILAKYIAADRVAKRIGGFAAAVVVDHDVVDPLRLDAVASTGPGHIGPAVVSIGNVRGRFILPRLAAPMSQSELARVRLDERLIETDASVIRHVLTGLGECRGVRSLAEQVAMANGHLLARWIEVEQFSAGRLVDTGGWRDFFWHVAEDAAACVRAYNAAVQRHPEGGTPPLFAMLREERWELPFWLLDTQRGRRAMYSDMVESPGFAMDRLATRAMSLTASVRLGLCDLFIHGTGGAVYDRATDAWIRGWLGRELATAVAITADVRRSFEIEARRDAVADDLARARWLAHSAVHNPELLGDSLSAKAKSDLVDQIQRAPYRSQTRADLYVRMHRLLDETCRRHRVDLQGIRDDVLAIEHGLTVQSLENKRDWPAVLLDPVRLDQLAEQIEGMVGSVSRGVR